MKQNKSQKFSILAIIFVSIVLMLPTISYASVVLDYANARQAYIDTFYGKTVAQLIYDESSQHNVNARLILVMLQRESAAITQSSPSSTTRAGWPLFYNYDERMANCLNGDEASCNDIKYNKSTYQYRAENYGGVGQQIAYATAQLRRLHDDGSYCGGSLVVSVDGGDLSVDNQATCALYKYTPHAVSYDTSSTFYTSWQSWWGGVPNGSTYSATNTISESNFSNASPLSASDINNFLISKNSWLANYSIPEYISVPFPIIYIAPSTPAAPPPRRAGDGNNDGSIDSTDLSILADQWGQNVSANTGADYNGDGSVESTDLSILADAWGT